MLVSDYQSKQNIHWPVRRQFYENKDKKLYYQYCDQPVAPCESNATCLD